MGRRPCCAKEGVNRGAWTAREDSILTNYVNLHGEGKWRDLPQKAGLNRCGKSCRLRWLNYLRPDIKRGNISAEEEELIIRLHGLLGNRWSLIAGRLPGRTDNEIKNYWNTSLSKRTQVPKTQKSTKKQKKAEEEETIAEPHQVIRTKATKCTKVVIPRKLNDETVEKTEPCSIKWDHKSPSSSSASPEDDSCNFFMDFDINDVLLSDLGDMKFNQEKENRGHDNDFFPPFH
ncbi:hypothetical protein LguiB_011915 [Lonicera macranthoides]